MMADIPVDLQKDYWKAQALYSSADASLRESLTDQQKKILEQISAYRAALEAAAKKACPDGLDQGELKKGNLVCIKPKEKN